MRSIDGQAIDRCEIAASVKADIEDSQAVDGHSGASARSASAIMALIKDAALFFASGRECTVFLGLTPRRGLDWRQNAAQAHHQDGRPLLLGLVAVA